MLLAAIEVHAQGDGARNYQLVPDGTRSFTAFALYARGNQAGDPSTVVQGAEIDAALFALQYTQVIKIGADQVQLFGVLPFGSVKGSATVAANRVSSEVTGLEDASLGVLYGLVGSPALGDRDYAAYRPGFTLGALGKVFMPTGEYDQAKAFNLGANRWALQLGAPLMQYFGSSFLDASLGSLELTPSVTFFTTNNAPHGGTTMKQDPLFKLEGHATRNLSRALWVSADAFYERGGETVTDGVANGDAQRWLMLGASVGRNVSNSVSALFSYGKVVHRNETGVELRGVRAEAIVSF